MSTDSRVFVVQVKNIHKHPNADTLSIVDVFGGYPCIIRTGDFVDGDLAAYVPVDMFLRYGVDRLRLIGIKGK